MRRCTELAHLIAYKTGYCSIDEYQGHTQVFSSLSASLRSVSLEALSKGRFVRQHPRKLSKTSRQHKGSHFEDMFSSLIVQMA